MASYFRITNLPYALVSGGLVACALGFGALIFSSGPLYAERAGMGMYPPSFSVQADVVRSVQVIPLAGAALRSPSVQVDTRIAAAEVR